MSPISSRNATVIVCLLSLSRAHDVFGALTVGQLPVLAGMFANGGLLGQTLVGEMLSPSAPVNRDHFGFSVSKHGDVAVVGAPNEGCVAPGILCGAAYVFRREVEGWVEWVRLAPTGPPTSGVDGKFGSSVAVYGDTVLVGKHAEGCPDGVLCGAVYMWRLNGDVWEEKGKLSGPEPECGDIFGVAISMDGDVAVVGARGAYFDCGIAGDNAGVYVFRKNSGLWALEAHLTPPSGGSQYFGESVKVRGDRIIVGASHSCQFPDDCGSAYVYRWDGNSWLQDGTLTSPEGDWFGYFGYAVSILGDVAVVGSPAETCEVGERCGAAYAFRRGASVWSLETVLTPVEPAESEWFGQAVDAGEETIVVGAQQHDCLEAGNCGAAYIYSHNGSNWVHQGRLLSANATHDGSFGYSVHIDGGTLMVGASSDPGVPQCPGTCGAAFFFDPIPADCNFNGISDADDIDNSTSGDCNANLRPDECDVPPFDPQGFDCNANQVPDECDLSVGASSDVNVNTIPDECDPPILVWASDPSSQLRVARSLQLETVPVGAVDPVVGSAIRVTALDLQSPDPPNSPCCPPPNFGAYESATCGAVGEANNCARWLGPAVTVRESQDNPALGTFVASRLQCTPYYADWTMLGSIAIVGPEIMPSSTYELIAYASSCNGMESTCTNLSDPVQALTRRSGDVAPPYAPTGTQPDPQDVVAVLNKFRNQTGAPGKAIAQIQPNVIELNVDVGALDIVAAIDAFRGTAYPFSGPCPCPSSVTCNATPCGPPACAGGGLCVRTCNGGTNAGQPCLNDTHCPSSACGTGFCRDHCGRCRD